LLFCHCLRIHFFRIKKARVCMTRTRRCCFRRDAAKERRAKYIVNLNRSFDSIDSRDGARIAGFITCGPPSACGWIERFQWRSYERKRNVKRNRRYTCAVRPLRATPARGSENVRSRCTIARCVRNIKSRFYGYCPTRATDVLSLFFPPSFFFLLFSSPNGGDGDVTGEVRVLAR